MTPGAAQVDRLRSLEDGPRALFDVVAAGASAISCLDSLLRGPTESVPQPRRLAAEALGAIGGAAALDALLAALDDSGTRELDPVLRLSEDAVLASIAEQLATAGERRAVEKLIALLAQHPHAGCVRALDRLGDARAIPVLTACLRDDFARGPAIEALRRFGRTAGAELSRCLLSPLIVRGYEGSSSIAARCAAAELIAEAAVVRLPLAWAMFDAQRSVRVRAALALTRSPDETRAVAPALIEALDSSDWVSLESIRQALLRLGPELVPLLVPVIREVTSPLQQVRAIDLLGRVAAVAELATLHAHPSSLAREAAAAALGSIATAESTHALRGFLQDPEGEVRLAALQALADRDPRVRRAARTLFRSRSRVRSIFPRN